MLDWVTVNDMLGYCLDNDIKLLSDFSIEGTADFWKEYRDNHELYDKLFSQRYKNFRYFDQEVGNEEDLGDITSRFIVDVLAHLTVNRKKYEELLRVNKLSDTDYDLMGNVNYTRLESGQATDNQTIIQGQRQDSSASLQGQRSDTIEEKVSPFESESYKNSNKTESTKGAETDTETITKGEQTDLNSRATQDNTTITVKGKNTAQSNSSIIDEHIKNWKQYEFYNYIFTSICKDLLLL